MIVGPFVLLPTSLVITKSANIHEWEKASKQLFMMQKHVPWWIGGMMRYGSAKFGDDVWQIVPEDTSEKLVNRFWSVEEKIPEMDRQEVLSWTHHVMALRVKHPQVRNALLRRAAEDRLDTEEFSKLIQEVQG